MNSLEKFVKDEDGQGMPEYALIIGVVSATAIVVLIAVGSKINSKFNELNNRM